MAVTSTTNTAGAFDPTIRDQQTAAMRDGAPRRDTSMQPAGRNRPVEDTSAPQATSTTGQTAAVEPTPAATRTEPAPAGAIGHSVNTLA
jgi:hypothetical protein